MAGDNSNCTCQLLCINSSTLCLMLQRSGLDLPSSDFNIAIVGERAFPEYQVIHSYDPEAADRLLQGVSKALQAQGHAVLEERAQLGAQGGPALRCMLTIGATQQPTCTIQ
jgi:hypothetical protein